MNSSGNIKNGSIAAVVIAGGLSTRMRAFKQLLPYGQHTVIEQIVSVLLQCPLDDVVVVTGHQRQAIEAKLGAWSVRPIFNPDYQEGEMLSSIQRGITALNSECHAAMLVLADQPQLEASVVGQLIEAYQTGSGGLVIPSFQMRRGHPIIIDQAYWPEILALTSEQSLRDVITRHADEIDYIVVETDSILRDIDTPEEYQQELDQLVAKKSSKLK